MQLRPTDTDFTVRAQAYALTYLKRSSPSFKMQIMQHDPERSPTASLERSSLLRLAPALRFPERMGRNRRAVFIYLYIGKEEESRAHTGKESGREGAAQPHRPRRLPRPRPRLGGQRLRGHRARRGGGAQVPSAAPPQGAATSCPGQPFPSSSSSLPSLLLRLFSDSKKLKSSSSPPPPPLRQGAAGGTLAPTHRHRRGAAGKRSEPCQILPMAAAAAETAPFSSFSFSCASWGGGKAPASPLRPHAVGREAPAAAASLPAARCSPGFAPPGKGHPPAVRVLGVCVCVCARGGGEG